MNIVFTGHRDKIIDVSILQSLANRYPNATWIHGNAIGFDSFVREFAELSQITQIAITPDYKKYHPKQAPLRRNDLMLSMADILFACYDGRKNGGTFYTVNRAKKLGIHTILVNPDNPQSPAW